MAKNVYKVYNKLKIPKWLYYRTDKAFSCLVECSVLAPGDTF